jgi:hypothetical protein
MRLRQGMLWLALAVVWQEFTLQTSVADPHLIPSPKQTKLEECTADDCLPVASSSRLSKKAVEAFLQWLTQNGATISDRLSWPQEYPSEIRNNPRKHLGVELKETSHDAEGQVLARIPLALALVANEDIEHKYGKVVNNLKELLDENFVPFSRLRPKNILLALALLEEKHKKDASFYAPYIATLPPLSEITHIEQFTADELEVFQDSNIPKYARFFLYRLRGVFDALKKAELLPTSSFAEFQWAHVMVRTRSAIIAGAETSFENQTIGLVPFLDKFRMADAYAYNVEWAAQDDAIELKSDGASGSGEATIFHGEFSNFFLLMNYGIVPEDNADEGYPLKLRPFVGDEDLRLAKERKWNASLDTPQKYVVVLNNERQPAQLLSFFRLLVVSDIKLVESTALDKPASPALEDVALASCSRMIVQELETQKSTLETDEEEMSGESQLVVQWNEVRALGFHYRIARKRILKTNKCFCDKLRTAHSRYLPTANREPEIPITNLEVYFDEYAKLGQQAFDDCFL